MLKLVIGFFIVIIAVVFINYAWFSEENTIMNHGQQKEQKVIQELDNYTFYDELTNKEVVVEVISDEDQQTKKESPYKKTNSPTVLSKDKTIKRQYQLQIGIFTSMKQADSLKAQLALSGIESNIKPFKFSNRNKMYMVRIGPSANLENLKQIKAVLESKNFKPLLMKTNSV